ncbi:MAG: type I restriction-modification enzyme R subunit C-terminal domain-containing protein, partial [Terrimicrobiaceae bacterium]
QLTDSVTGAAVTTAQVKEEYTQTELDERLLMKERVEEMSRSLFDQFVAHGGTPEQKTIAFCASDRHADAIATALNGLYQDWCATHGQDAKAFYAFKCTAKVDGSEMVKDLRGSASSHFIACTVELLSTGVDVPCVRNLAFLQYVRSPIVFYQMLGRGTRIDPDTEKLMFRVYDYTDATNLLGQDFKTKYKPSGPGGGPRPTPPPADPPVLVEGVQILIAPTGRWLTAMIDERHSRITVEEYRERVAERLVASASTLDQFRIVWVQPPERRSLINEIVGAGFPPRALQVAEEAEDCDLYDVLGEVGYGLNRMTKANRAFAFTYKHRPWLEAMPTDTAATVRAIASQFSRGGTESLETPHIFQTPEVRKAGGLEALAVLGEPSGVLMETKERLFAA